MEAFEIPFRFFIVDLNKKDIGYYIYFAILCLSSIWLIIHLILSGAWNGLFEAPIFFVCFLLFILSIHIVIHAWRYHELIYLTKVQWLFHVLFFLAHIIEIGITYGILNIINYFLIGVEICGMFILFLIIVESLSKKYQLPGGD